MAEETKDAKRALPKAILYTVFIAGTLFIIISYAAHLSYPAWRDFLPNTDIASIQVMEKVGGALMASSFITAYVIGVFASAMTSQASIVRIFYAMGREGCCRAQCLPVCMPDSTRRYCRSCLSPSPH